MPSNVYAENNIPVVSEAGGYLTKKNIKIVGGVGVFDVSGAASVNFGAIPISSTGANGSVNAPIVKNTPQAINSSATATAAQVASGYITSTSGAATTITLPTGTLLGAQLGASQGTIFELYIDNTAGANTVTIAVAVNGVLSAAAVAVSASFGLLTVPSGVTGVAEFTLMFSSPTAYVFTRTG